MEMYGNEKYLESEIVEQSRHLFVYGYANDYRSSFLKKMEDNYPVEGDSNKPIALYFESFGLPNMDVKDKNKYYIHTMANEYFQFLVASRLLERIVESGDNNLDEKFARVIKLSNQGKNKDHPDMKNIQDLLRELKKSRDFYYRVYMDYTNGKLENIPIEELAIPFLQLEMFVSLVKDAMNIDSHVSVILDNKDDYLSSSVQTVNNFIGGRINADISIKVATDPRGWKTYRDTNGQFIESIHDYGDIELDDSYKNCLSDLKRL